MINKVENRQNLISVLQNNEGSEKVSDKSFKDTLTNFLQEVNQLQIEDAETTEAFLKGEITDLHQVTIAAQKARISLELLLEIRNKLVESYQEIMRMQL